MKKVLVTGGAGFIGSHTVDLLLEKGYIVRVLDNLEYPTHMQGKPSYLSEKAEFIRGDVRNIDDLSRALRGVDSVIHLAATGGFTPDIVKYFECNSIGTANLLELIHQQKFRVNKIVVASSVGIYGEGLYKCGACGPMTGVPRPLQQLKAQQWELKCPSCGEFMEHLPTKEQKIPSPEKAYSISKYDEERLVLGFGRDYDIHTCALRYFLTYGPRQSLTNPYTGVISIFSSRILNNIPPIIYEDGNQTRDFVYVSDVAKANLLALESTEARGRVFNVGTGQPTKIKNVVAILGELLDKHRIAPELPGEYRPGESRHIYADISEICRIGYRPSVSLRQGIEKYISWISSVGEVREYLSGALAGLKRTSVVCSTKEHSDEPVKDSLSVIVPAYNEEGNLESIVRYIISELENFIDDFEVVIINDGSNDGTDVIADRLSNEDQRIRVIHHPFNVGYGGAQKSGYKHATKEWVVLVPADHQFDSKDLEKFLNARDGSDIIGSVRIDRKDHWTRCLTSDIYNWYMKAFYRVPLDDINWIKMFRRKLFDQIEIETHGFAVDAEILVKAMSLGCRTKQIPIVHHNRTWGTPTAEINLKNIYKTTLELFYIKGMLKRFKTKNRLSE